MSTSMLRVVPNTRPPGRRCRGRWARGRPSRSGRRPSPSTAAGPRSWRTQTTAARRIMPRSQTSFGAPAPQLDPHRCPGPVSLRQVAPLAASAGPEEWPPPSGDDRRRAAPSGRVEQVGHRLPTARQSRRWRKVMWRGVSARRDTLVGAKSGVNRLSGEDTLSATRPESCLVGRAAGRGDPSTHAPAPVGGAAP